MSTIEKAVRLKRTAVAGAAAADRNDPEARGTRWVGDAGDEAASRAELAVGVRGDEVGADSLAPRQFAARGPLLRVSRSDLRRQSMYPPVTAETRLANEYRRIKRPLLGNAMAEGAFAIPNANRIMLTSALPAEGKTFTALNLALSIARDPDYEVTLVDADLTGRTTSRLFGVADAPGLMDLLAGGSLDPAALTRPTTISSLSVLPAGSWHALSAELIASARMAAFADHVGAAGRQHIVIFDAPPVLASPDALALAGHVGQVVFVVRAGQTGHYPVTAALDQFDPDQLVHILLNQGIGSAGSDYYGGRCDGGGDPE